MEFHKTTKMTMTRDRIQLLVQAFALLLISTHVTVEAISDLQLMICRIKDPSLRTCNPQCPEGVLWKNGCPTCQCKNSICQGYCQDGYRCVIVDKAGSYYAVCQPDTTMGQTIQAATTAVPITQPYVDPRARNQQQTTAFLPDTRDLPDAWGTCDFQGRCDATGHCPNANSVCRRDGVCCRVAPSVNDNNEFNNNDEFSNNGPIIASSVPRCLQKPSVGRCRALGIQYVYNVTTGQCESMIFGGCTTSANSFPTLENCQATCEQPCRKPITPGRCRASLPRYYFNDEKERCEPFDYGGCLGNANNFMTQWDCEAHCKGLKKNKMNANQDRAFNVPGITQSGSSWYSSSGTYSTVNSQSTVNSPSTVNSQSTSNWYSTSDPGNKLTMVDRGQTTKENHEGLRNDLLNSFTKVPRIQDKALSAQQVTSGTKVNYRARPYPGKNNRESYVSLPDRTSTTTKLTTAAAPTTINNSGNRNFADFLSRRARYMQDYGRNQARNKMTYRQRARSTPNTYRPVVNDRSYYDRGYNANPAPNSYLQSVQAIMHLLNRG